MADPEDSQLIEKFHRSPEPQTPAAAKIIAMGVGGGGCNAVAYMHSQGVKGVEFVVLNTDKQALDPIPVDSKILLGPQTTRGLGAGGHPEIGEQAARESVPEIEKLLTDEVKMVFVTAGMGGGTGTGGAPIVAEVAKRRGILTVGIVTIPFFFEGMNKINSAIAGAARLQKNVDAMLIINNDRLGDIYPDLEWDKAFSKADDILTTAARTISEMVTSLAVLNIDMRDVDTCLRDGRTALISVGYGEGPNRMSEAMKAALHSPLLCDTDIMSAKELLFAFYYSKDIQPPFKVSETLEANSLVSKINEKVHIKFGWGYDDSLGNKVKFTILASGFDVSVDTGGQVRIIEGRKDEVPEVADVSQAVMAAYGREKIDDMMRLQETQNYYILTTEQLDSDEAIEMVENSPAFKRDRRKQATSATETAVNEERQGTERTSQPSPDNTISFYRDDK